MWFYPSVPLKNEQNCHEIGEYKMSVSKKTAGLWSGKFSDLNSACLKVLVYLKKFGSKTCLMKVNDIATQKIAF